MEKRGNKIMSITSTSLPNTVSHLVMWKTRLGMWVLGIKPVGSWADNICAHKSRNINIFGSITVTNTPSLGSHAASILLCRREDGPQRNTFIWLNNCDNVMKKCEAGKRDLE